MAVKLLGSLTTSAELSVEDNLYLTDAGTVRGKIELNATDRDDVDIKATSLGSNMKFFTVDTERMRINDYGAVLIGTSNTNGGKADFAVGSPQISWYSGQIQIGGTDMNWNAKGYVDSGIFNLAAWDGHIRLFTQGSSSATSKDIILSPQATGGSATERVRLKGDTGNFGIGTNAPLEKLHVVGKINSSNNIVSNSTYTMFTGRSSRTVDDYGGLNKEYFKANLVTPGPDTTGESSAHGIADLRFQLANSAGNTNMSDIMTLRSGGNVGIGTTSPAQKLHVNGASIIADGNTAIDPDVSDYSVVAGAINDGGGWAVNSGIGGRAAGAGDTWAIGHNGTSLYMGIGNGTAVNTLSTFLRADANGTIALTAYGAGLLQTDASGNVSVDTNTYSTATGVADNADVTPSWVPATDPGYSTLAIGTTATTAMAGNTTIPTNNNQLTNGAGYITTVPSEYLTQNEGDARYVSFEKEDRSVPSSGGWYRLAKISRGGARFAISYTGGNMSPHTYVIDAFKNWNNEATIAVEKFGHANYITSFRISRREGTGNGDYYLEGEFISLSNTHSFEARFQESLGYTNISEIYAVSSGSVLAASDSTDSEIIEELDTTASEGLYLKNMNLDGRLNIYTDANTSSTTALVLNGTEVEKRTLGSNAFSSTSFAPLASPALTGTPTAPTAAAATNTTQVATTAFVTTAVSNLVDSSPAALNTLNELAAALGDDASFSTTMSTALGNRLRIDVNNQSLSSTELTNARTNLGLGTAATSAATDFVAVSGDTMTGSLTVEGDLTVGKDGTTPQVKLIYDDNHTNGDRWDTIIDIGKTEDRHSGDGQYPTYVTHNGYSISFQSNSDGVLFGMEERVAGNYRPVIAWGDDNSDTPFNFRFNNSVVMSLGYNGVLTSTGNMVAGGNLKTTLNLDMRGQDVENATNVIYFNANNGNGSNTSNDVGTGITWKPLYSGYTKRSAGIMQIGEGNYFKSGLAFYTNNSSDNSTDWSERMRISKEGNVGIGVAEPTLKLEVAGAVHAGGKRSYTKIYASLDTTGQDVAGLVSGGNGNSASFTFTCHGHTGGYQKIVYSCYNTSATTWNVKKVIDEGTNDFDVTVSASGATRTFTFVSRSGTKSYSPMVHVEHVGHGFDSSHI